MKPNNKISDKLKHGLLGMMLRIRAAEEKIVEVYPEQQIRTPTHLSIGQEAVATGVCLALKSDDQVFAPHRCHAAYIAKGGSVDAFFAELCGRANGANGGRGGSAHLSAAEVGMYSSPILGGMIPVAVGAALSFQMGRSRRIAVAFLGDAAIEEGAFAESLNFAIIKKLPVLFVCENNLYSTHSHLKYRQPHLPIYKRVAAAGLPAWQHDGNDVELVYRSAQSALRACRSGKGPMFLEYLTYRFREHVGPLYDYDKGYRTKAEVARWQKQCPIKRYSEKLVRQKSMTKKDIQAIEEEGRSLATQAYQKALKSPWPALGSLLDHVY